MAERSEDFSRPKEQRRRIRLPESKDRFGRFTEAFARGMGTPAFLIGMTIFCTFWLGYNSLVPPAAQFDPQSQGFPLLTLVLSLQASYAAPLLLLAQNRQDDRDRVQIEQDRLRAERNLNDTEYLAREVVALRMAMRDMATREFIRAELKSFVDDLDERRDRDERTAR
ncbi:DUF1003 domain-containing protein [Agrococcus sp. Ld7]|uniref:DUF1003 domain-containing protein n=1 Tax=Agrococcus sp. Ld7 TaxID=649148 RepID=UPI003864EFEE